MGRIRGISITLYERTETGRDEANEPVYTETPTFVSDVLVAPASESPVIDSDRLKGRTAVYTLGIPKGDTHEWEGRRVQFFGETWQVIGEPTEGIEHLIPLAWNKKVRVERIE